MNKLNLSDSDGYSISHYNETKYHLDLSTRQISSIVLITYLISIRFSLQHLSWRSWKVGKWIYLIGYVKKFARNHEHYLMLIIQNMGRRWWNMSVQKEKVDNVYARLYRSHYFLNTCFESYVCYNYKFLFSLNCILRDILIPFRGTISHIFRLSVILYPKSRTWYLHW